MSDIKALSTPSTLGAEFSFLLSEWKQMLSLKTASYDIWAGITVALVAMPLNLALAIAAGVEPGVGISTGIIAGVIGGLFGGQKLAITGPAAAIAVVLAEIAENYGMNAIWLVCLSAGILQLLAALFKLGRFISFLPMPVIIGFANAIGVLLFFNAIDDFLGLPIKSIAHAGLIPLSGTQFIPDFIVDLMHIWQRCFVHEEMNLSAVLMGVSALALAYWTPKVTKVVPGQLIAIVVTTLACILLGLHVPVVKDIASISPVLPTASVPALPWHDFVPLFPFVITVFLLGSIESLLSASVADGMTGSSRHRPNQELMGQGLANFVVPFFGGIPVTGVITRTAVNIKSGARTRLSALVHSITLSVLIFFLAKYIEQIPLASLAAILMLTGIRSIEWEAMSQMWRGSRTESCVAIATTLAAVGVDLTAGVFTGLVLACALFIGRMSALISVAEGEENEIFQDLPNCKFVRTYVLDGPLFFGAAERFVENIVIVDDVKVLILHMKAARVLDLTGIDTLLSIQSQLQKQNGRLVLAEVPQQPMRILERSGALDKIGRQNIFPNYRSALISVNQEQLDSTCKSCCLKDGNRLSGPKDCRLRNALLDESSPAKRMMEAAGKAPARPSGSGLEWLFSIVTEDDIPSCLQDTPIATLLKGQNLGLIDQHDSPSAELLIGMCIDFRKSLSIPRDWAYMIRREGANMEGAEFAVALAVSKGIKYMALIAHNDCAMANTAEHREQFVRVLSEKCGWGFEKAAHFFEEHALSREIGNEIDFVLEEANRLKALFPGLEIVPMLFRVEDDRLYLIYDWLQENAASDSIMQKLQLRNTGGFKINPSDLPGVAK